MKKHHIVLMFDVFRKFLKVSMIEYLSFIRYAISPPVLLFSKLNETFHGYFDPENNGSKIINMNNLWVT